MLQRGENVRLSEVTRWHQALHLAALFFPECQLSEWSQWGACVKTSKPCGLKKGTRSRMRRPLRVWDPPSQTCAPQTQRRKCAAPKTPCKRAQGPRPRGGGTVLCFHFHFIDRLETRGTVQIREGRLARLRSDNRHPNATGAPSLILGLLRHFQVLQMRNIGYKHGIKSCRTRTALGHLNQVRAVNSPTEKMGIQLTQKQKRKKKGFLPFQGFKCPRSCGCRAPV